MAVVSPSDRPADLLQLSGRRLLPARAANKRSRPCHGDLATRALGLSWPVLAAGGLLTGIGFTMSLFIAGLAYAPAILDAAKIGILAGSAVSAATGILVLAWLTSKKRTA